jgi:hypothetical protein
MELLEDKLLNTFFFNLNFTFRIIRLKESAKSSGGVFCCCLILLQKENRTILQQIAKSLDIFFQKGWLSTKKDNLEMIFLDLFLYHLPNRSYYP